MTIEITRLTAALDLFEGETYIGVAYSVDDDGEEYIAGVGQGDNKRAAMDAAAANAAKGS